MRKILVLCGLCGLAASLLIAGIMPTDSPNPVFINGRSFGSARFLNGQWAVSLEDFAKAFGNSPTLEPNFQLLGNRLTTTPFVKKHIAGVKYEDITVNAGSGMSKGMRPLNSNAPSIRSGGVVSDHVFMAYGKAWVPLADIAKAFGATFSAPANRPPAGARLDLHFAQNPTAILQAAQ